jgi:RNA polymerase sigma factor (sigma-70 family)
MTDLASTLGEVLGNVPDRSWPDDRLLTACRGGDQRAWEALVAKYQSLVYSIPYRYGATADDAADIFQAVWMDLYRELPHLRNAEALRSWLATVAGRRSLRWKRGLQRRGEVDLPDEDRDEPENAAPLAPEVMAEVERDQAVREAIANLPERCRELVKLLFLKDPPISYGEVAAHFGLATGSIGFIRGRCIRKLQKALEERGLRPS